MNTQTPNDARLIVDGLSKAYVAGKPVLEDLNFIVRKGEMLAIVGPSGAGKTTLLRCLVVSPREVVNAV